MRNATVWKLVIHSVTSQVMNGTSCNNKGRTLFSNIVSTSKIMDDNNNNGGRGHGGEAVVAAEAVVMVGGQAQKMSFFQMVRKLFLSDQTYST